MRTLTRLRLARDRNLLLGTVMERLAEVHGNRVAVEQAGDPPLTLTYREAADLVARWAGGLAGRVEPGDRVVVALPNGYEHFLACLAVSRAGGVAVPANPGMQEDEVEHVVADSQARVVLRALEDLVEGEPGGEPAPADPDDVTAIFYTSGTTGRPKGARLTHRALLVQATPAALWPSGLRRDEAVISLPVAHIMGFVVLLVLAAGGVPTWFLPKFRPVEVLDAIEGRRATVFVGVPAMYRMLLDAGAEERDLRSVRLWATGADVMPDDLARRFKRMGATVTLPFGPSFGEAMFASGYGQVESAGGVAVKFSPPMLPVGLGEGLGIPMPPYRMRVVGEDGRDVRRGEVGELVVKGPGVLRGYHSDDEATRAVLTEDGWLRTGDLARRGPLGLVHFAGRKKDVIKSGGFSVFAAEVEHALEQHPDVAEAAVAGRPDERMGEVPVAAVRLAPGSTVTGDELVAWARDHLAGYKAPRQVKIVEDLPRTGTQKVRRREVLAHFDGG